MADARTPEEIWSDDRFGRQAEAELLIAYIECASKRPSDREDLRSLTLAIDAGYGEGKSFFLRRLSEHLSLNHPVAFVDAWTDDIADEPLTAIAATLKRALDPLIETSPDIQTKWQGILRTTGEVAKIALGGLTKRGLSLLFTAGAVAQAGELFSDEGDVSNAIIEEAGKTGDRLVEGIESTFKSVAPDALMKRRIEEFEKGRDAISALRTSLAALVASLENQTLHAPIVVIIDELDRCRPTYAIKLLEEVKHLFDVPGVVFIFGMHREQLAFAIRGAYGAEFAGDVYLRRFISRTYRLREPDLTPLLAHLFKLYGLEESRLQFPQVVTNGELSGYGPVPTPEIVARYMRAMGASARDAFHVVDSLQTSLSLTGKQLLIGPYLVHLIVSSVLGAKAGDLLELSGSKSEYAWHDVNGGLQTTPFARLSDRFAKAAQASIVELSKTASSRSDLASEWVYRYREAAVRGQVSLAMPQNYPALIEAVGRFRNIEFDEAEA